MPGVLHCPFCGATSVETVLPADESSSGLESLVCTACSNQWWTRPAVAHTTFKGCR